MGVGVGKTRIFGLLHPLSLGGQQSWLSEALWKGETWVQELERLEGPLAVSFANP